MSTTNLAPAAGRQGSPGPAGVTPTVDDLPDFWRSNNGNTPPDGTTDYTEAVNHNGNIGVGLGFLDPIARLDVALGARTGTDGRVAGTTGLYVTGPLTTIANGVTTPAAGVQFRHSNQTQGVGIAYDGIYATGNAANQSFTMMQRGTGFHRKIWQSPTTALDDLWNQSAFAAGVAIQERALLGGGTHVGSHYKAFVQSVGPNQVRQQFDIVTNGSLAAALRIEPDLAQLGNTSLRVGENRTNNRKIVLYSANAGADASTSEFYGFGLNGSTLRYQVGSSGGHRFMAATGTPNTSRAIAVLLNNGTVGIGNTTTNTATPNETTAEPRIGTLTVGTDAVLATNAVAAPVPILSLSRPGTNAVVWPATASFDLGHHTVGINALSELIIRLGNGAVATPDVTVARFWSNGRINMPLIPTFATNTAAVAGGLVAGDLYKTTDALADVTHLNIVV